MSWQTGRSLKIGMQISLDYLWSLHGLDETSKEYLDVIKEVHTRSAVSLAEGCMRNGGLYVKLGQGLVAMNHILPKEYIDNLKVTDLPLHR
jgi:aarF domain-containing kinase